MACTASPAASREAARRRVGAPGRAVDAAPGAVPDLAGRRPRGGFAAWRAAFDDWRRERAAWAAAGGVWPGGEDQRELAEALETPDEAFPASVRANVHARVPDGLAGGSASNVLPVPGSMPTV